MLEVAIAATMLIIGVMGTIQAITIGSEMMATAKRQTYAAQIINYELEKLRQLPWEMPGSSPINDLSDYSTGTATVAIDKQLWPAWDATTPYAVNNVVSYYNAGAVAWYRCTSACTNVAPTNTANWTPVSSSSTSYAVQVDGADFTLTRVVSDDPPNLKDSSDNYIVRRFTFTVSWTVRATSGTAARTVSRTGTGYFGKYGLNLTYRRL
ncbi:MAG: hypothetical protein C0502_05425 [Opitutus sp.]|nr:hypothetical protein [Opitutus sp.]